MPSPQILELEKTLQSYPLEDWQPYEGEVYNPLLRARMMTMFIIRS